MPAPPPPTLPSTSPDAQGVTLYLLGSIHGSPPAPNGRPPQSTRPSKPPTSSGSSSSSPTPSPSSWPHHDLRLRPGHQSRHLPHPRRSRPAPPRPRRNSSFPVAIAMFQILRPWLAAITLTTAASPRTASPPPTASTPSCKTALAPPTSPSSASKTPSSRSASSRPPERDRCRQAPPRHPRRPPTRPRDPRRPCSTCGSPETSTASAAS